MHKPIQFKNISLFFPHKTCFEDFSNPIFYGNRIAIIGNNGSSKSTLIKAIMNKVSFIRQGDWQLPNPVDISYLDQHYSTLPQGQSVLDTLNSVRDNGSYLDRRSDLNDFLFRKNEEVQASVSTLSGGEKARLSLAQIAAKTPKLLILDEMTNNIDRETRDPIIQVLKAYPGAMIVISHDESFMTAIDGTERFQINDGILTSS